MHLNQSLTSRSRALLAMGVMLAAALLLGGGYGAAVAKRAGPRQTSPDTKEMLLDSPLQSSELPPGDVAALPFESGTSPALSTAVTAVRNIITGPTTSGTNQYVDYYLYASPGEVATAFAQAQALESDPSVAASGTPDGYSVPAFWVNSTYGPDQPGGQSDCIAQVDNLLVDAAVLTLGAPPADNHVDACALAQAGVAHAQQLGASANPVPPSGVATAPARATAPSGVTGSAPPSRTVASLPPCIGSHVSPGQTYACAAPAGQWTRHVSMSWQDSTCPGDIAVSFNWGDTADNSDATTVTSTGPCRGTASATHVYNTSDGDSATYTVTTSDPNLPNPFLTMNMTFEASVSAATVAPAADTARPLRALPRYTKNLP